jgi:hypothetical protein
MLIYEAKLQGTRDQYERLDNAIRPRRPERWDLVNAIAKIRGTDAVPRLPMIIYRENSDNFYKELRAVLYLYNFGLPFTIWGRNYSQSLPNGKELYIQPDLSEENPNLTSGQVWIEKEGKKISSQRFSNFDEMRFLVKKMLNNRRQTPRR